MHLRIPNIFPRRLLLDFDILIQKSQSIAGRRLPALQCTMIVYIYLRKKKKKKKNVVYNWINREKGHLRVICTSVLILKNKKVYIWANRKTTPRSDWHFCNIKETCGQLSKYIIYKSVDYFYWSVYFNFALKLIYLFVYVHM